MARIVAATPHSCDVERLISAHNRLKSVDRTSLSGDTLNDYLHVMFNMPDLAHYNAWPAVNLWLTEKDRREWTKPPSKDSEWFFGVLPESRQAQISLYEGFNLKFRTDNARIYAAVMCFFVLHNYQDIELFVGIIQLH